MKIFVVGATGRVVAKLIEQWQPSAKLIILAKIRYMQ